MHDFGSHHTLLPALTGGGRAGDDGDVRAAAGDH